MRLFQACQPCDGTLEIPARAPRLIRIKPLPEGRNRCPSTAPASPPPPAPAASQHRSNPASGNPAGRDRFLQLGSSCTGAASASACLNQHRFSAVVEQLIKPQRPVDSHGRRRHRQRVEHIQPVGVQPIDKRLPKPGVGDQEIRNAQRGEAERFAGGRRRNYPLAIFSPRCNTDVNVSPGSSRSAQISSEITVTSWAWQSAMSRPVPRGASNGRSVVRIAQQQQRRFTLRRRRPAGRNRSGIPAGFPAAGFQSPLCRSW